MAVIRTHTMSALISVIEAAVPALRGKICKMGEPNQPREWPTLQILPIRFKYYPMQSHEHKELGAHRLVEDVGRHEGTIQLRLGATNPQARWDLEDEILDIFTSQEGRPGVLLTTIEEVHDAVVAWELDTDEWENEMVFTKKFFSIMTVTVQIPALVVRGSVYTIEHLRFALTEDLETEYTDLPAGSIETVTIDEDGGLTQYP